MNTEEKAMKALFLKNTDKSTNKSIFFEIFS